MICIVVAYNNRGQVVRKDFTEGKSQTDASIAEMSALTGVCRVTVDMALEV